MMDALAEILGDEITREVHLQATLYAMDGGEGAGEGFVMADVGYDDIVLRYFGKSCGVNKKGFQLFQTCAVLSGNEEFGCVHIGKRDAQGLEAFAGNLVALVEEEDELLLFAMGENLFFQLFDVESGVRVDHPKDDVGLTHLLEGALDTYTFHYIRGLAYAGRVDKTEGDTAKVDGVFDNIAGGAMNVAHDGLFFVQQGIEKG